MSSTLDLLVRARNRVASMLEKEPNNPKWQQRLDELDAHIEEQKGEIPCPSLLGSLSGSSSGS